MNVDVSRTATGDRARGQLPKFQPYNRRHDHGKDDLAGYVIVRTDWREGSGEALQCTDVAEVVGATNYSAALDLVHPLRVAAVDGTHYVIDCVYGDGCRRYVNGRCVA